MQQIVHRFNSFSADILGWAGVRRGLLHTYWHSTRSAIVSRRARRPAEVAEPTPRLEPGREWELVTGRVARELARAPEIAAIQARAAVKIDAAEHAYKRIAADFAKVLAAPVAPTLRPACRLTHRPDPQARQPLAA